MFDSLLLTFLLRGGYLHLDIPPSHGIVINDSPIPSHDLYNPLDLYYGSPIWGIKMTEQKSQKNSYTEIHGDPTVGSIDPFIDEIVGYEEIRQNKKIIMIASESLCPEPVKTALKSVFTNIYGEGYPSFRMTFEDRNLIEDKEYHLLHYRRYSNLRYYKGCDYIDFAEAIAQRRIAELFATDNGEDGEPGIPAKAIFANVQPLSGAAANNAVYEAFLQPGDTVMGLDLLHGGHLTHGSRANRSGKLYRIVSYTVDQPVDLPSRSDEQILPIAAVDVPATFKHIATPVLTEFGEIILNMGDASVVFDEKTGRMISILGDAGNKFDDLITTMEGTGRWIVSSWFGSSLTH